MDGLREKYGPPISQTFVVHEGIGVTVKHGSDGSIREMLITPVRSETLAPSRNMTFTNEQAKHILQELVPTSKRGKFIIGGFVDGICMPENDCGGSSENYENVSIYYNSSSQPGQLCYIDVQFKK
jgi:hypothetical protein